MRLRRCVARRFASKIDFMNEFIWRTPQDGKKKMSVFGDLAPRIATRNFDKMKVPATLMSGSAATSVFEWNEGGKALASEDGAGAVKIKEP